MLFEVLQEAGFSGAGESGEDLEGRLGIGEEGFEVVEDEFAEAFVAAVDDAGAPADGA